MPNRSKRHYARQKLTPPAGTKWPNPLEHFCSAHELTQEAVAAAWGLNRATITRWSRQARWCPPGITDWHQERTRRQMEIDARAAQAATNAAAELAAQNAAEMVRLKEEAKLEHPRLLAGIRTNLRAIQQAGGLDIVEQRHLAHASRCVIEMERAVHGLDRGGGAPPAGTTLRDILREQFGAPVGKLEEEEPQRPAPPTGLVPEPEDSNQS